MARELDYLTVQVQVQVRGGWREWRLGFAFRGRDKTRQAGDETGKEGWVDGVDGVDGKNGGKSWREGAGSDWGPDPV